MENKMIKLKNLLHEDKRSSSISERQMFQALETLRDVKQSLLDNIANDRYIYRGVRQDDLYYIVEPRQFSRKSKNTVNFYTLLVDNMPSWINYPKRSKSIICTTDHYKPRSYGTTFVVIPLESMASFGVCPENDFWYSFRDGLKVEYMSYFNNSICRMAGLISDSNSFPAKDNILATGIAYPSYNLTYEQLMQFFDVVDNNKQFMRSNPPVINALENIFSDCINGDAKIHDVLMQQMTPTANKFSLLEYYKNSSELPENREVWTDSKCLLIRLDEFELKKDKLVEFIGNL